MRAKILLEADNYTLEVDEEEFEIVKLMFEGVDIKNAREVLLKVREVKEDLKQQGYEPKLASDLALFASWDLRGQCRRASNR